MSLATHDLIQASPLCRVPLPLVSSYFLSLSLWLPISLLFLSIYIYLSFILMMKANGQQSMCNSRRTFQTYMLFLQSHVLLLRVTSVMQNTCIPALHHV